MSSQDTSTSSGMQPPSSLFDIPAPPPLPEPGVLSRLIFESPWLISAALFGCGLIVLFWMRSRDRTRHGLIICGVLVMAAIGLVGIASWVETPRERVMLSTRSLVRAVADADAQALDARMDDACELYYFETPTGLGKRAIIDLVRSRMSSGAVYSIKGGADGVRFEAMQASVRGDSAQAQVKVAVTSAQWGVPHRSWWRLDLKRDREGEWRAVAIMPTSIQGVQNASGR